MQLTVKKKSILVIFGTRPECIKMWPLIVKLQSNPEFVTSICVSGQHREMLSQMLKNFNINPDFDLEAMSHNLGMVPTFEKILGGLNKVIEKISPDMLLVHGDTNTALAGALAGYYNKIPVGHVEAGLRTQDIFSPWPEEGNRTMISTISSLHFAPTEVAIQNLTETGVSKDNVYLTGNTVIDALLLSTDIIGTSNTLEHIDKKLTSQLLSQKRMILVTSHRRENFDGGIRNICMALKKIASERSDTIIVFSVHLNPEIRGPVIEMLSNECNIVLIEPQNYFDFVSLMMCSYVIATDSGGIQEEAPTLNVPVLVMREKTERPEAVSTGAIKLVGASMSDIVGGLNEILDRTDIYAKMAESPNPFGQGDASVKICRAISNYFSQNDGMSVL